MKRNPRIVSSLNHAVTTMRDACEEAARAIAAGNDEQACQRVLHALSWGFANASGSIETAMAAVSDAHQVAMLPVAIQYKDGVPQNLPNGVGSLLLYGQNGEYAEGPVLGGWDSTSGVWSDDRCGDLDWVPLFYSLPARNPCKDVTAPTVGNEVV